MGKISRPKFKTKYFEANSLLPYQRRFIFVNMIRGVGKSYGLQKFILGSAINKGEEFIYIVRTQDIKKKNALQKAFKKVVDEQFPNYEFRYTTEEMYLVTEDGEDILLGYCIALSESVKVKINSFPRVKYMMEDEYMLEAKDAWQYVQGWNEPDLLLSLYHTVDRDRDKVFVFLLGNNTAFFNPYHLHPAFKIPEIKEGELWKSDNVLFCRPLPSEELLNEKKESKFLQMIQDTEYGRYADKGEYVGDNLNFIMELSTNASYMMTLAYNTKEYGVYYDKCTGYMFISDKVDKYCKSVFALTTDDHTEKSILVANKKFTQLEWLSRGYKNGKVKFVNMEVKVQIEEGICKIL